MLRIIVPNRTSRDIKDRELRNQVHRVEVTDDGVGDPEKKR
jgi:hypothetical protein